MSGRLNRLRSTGSSMYRYLTTPLLRKKASNSWFAVKDTYFSAKDIFERHKVILTLATSMASVATGCIGYSLRHFHESRVEQRLEKIESSMKNQYQISDPEFKKLVNGVSIPACVASAGTTLFIGYFLGWRGGKWYSTRKFRREQMKLLGQTKPRQWPLMFLKGHLPLLGKMKPKRWPLRVLRRHRITEDASKTSETVAKDAAALRLTENAAKTQEIVAKDAANVSS